MTESLFNQQNELIAKLYNTHSGGELSKITGLSISAIYSRANKMGLSKRIGSCDNRDALIVEMHKSTPIKEIAEILGVTENHVKHRCYKLGLHKGINIPAEIGTVRKYTRSKCGTEIVVIKVREGHGKNNWTPYTHYIWEKENGKVPDGMIVMMKGNRRVDNHESITANDLELTTRADNLNENGMHSYPKELRELIGIRSQITKAINKRIENE